MTDEARQKAIGCLMFAAVGMVALGAVLTLMLMGGGALRMANTQGKEPGMLVLAGVGPLLILLGLLTAAAAVVAGVLRNRSSARREAMLYPGARVLARYALMPGTDEMVFSEFDPTLPGIRFYARLRLPDGRTSELQCPYPVFETLGEGMWGDATIQGDWIGAFVARRPGVP